MSVQMDLACDGSVVQELASGSLGDARLNQRRNRIMAILERHPDRGFPEACANSAEAEAFYRFLRNERIDWTAIVEPHLAATRARCVAAGEVLIIHDTTDLVFAGDAPREGLTRLGPSRHGFWLHTSLAVAADGSRTPLGVLGLQPFVRPARGAARPPKKDRERFHDPLKESRYWREGVAAVRAALPPETDTIHVMDRGADSYESFAEWVTQGDRFIVRLTHDRRVQAPAGSVGALSTALAEAPIVCQREVGVAPRRDGKRTLSARTLHPARAGRTATLAIAATHVELSRPREVSAAAPATLPVHVVRVSECDAPVGTEPIEWRLITTEPIGTREQIERIVDAYRTRWLIEEFFKALKTGCAYEKRQLESYQTLLVALALLAPIAWRLLLLRHLAREIPTAAATTVLSAPQLQVLRAVPQGRMLTTQSTVRDVLAAIARLGGHLAQNGSPGWLILGRGYQKLCDMELGWIAATTVLSESTDQS